MTIRTYEVSAKQVGTTDECKRSFQLLNIKKSYEKKDKNIDSMPRH
jgi:hypothetical protein